MSEKKDKQIRMFARQRYDVDLFLWEMNKPSKWRFFKYRKWKKSKPRYAAIENAIKNIAKKKG